MLGWWDGTPSITLFHPKAVLAKSMKCQRIGINANKFNPLFRSRKLKIPAARPNLNIAARLPEIAIKAFDGVGVVLRECAPGLDDLSPGGCHEGGGGEGCCCS